MTDLILAFESSCDETAVAAVDATGRVWAERLESQIGTHALYGGVVPEVASRHHFLSLDALVRSLLKDLPADSRIVRVAAASGPGLVGPLLVGVSYAKGFARGRNIPYVGVHHLRGHLASALIDGGDGRETLRERAARLFPALVLLVSGGHTQILEVDPNLSARKRADTADDAAGECFDKAAKIMGLPYPGGPRIEALAAQLTESDRALAQRVRSELPKPRSKEGFSFSGLKTAVRLKLEKEPALSGTPAFAWALQETIGETLEGALGRLEIDTDAKSFVLCGGVSANKRLRGRFEAWAKRQRLNPIFPPLKYATDNAVMIAAAAWVQDDSLALDAVHARLPLELGAAS